MIKKIVIEFEAGSEDRVTDKVFETAIKHIRRSGGKVVNMRTEDVGPERRVERRKDFSIPDLSKNLSRVISAYKREKGLAAGYGDEFGLSSVERIDVFRGLDEYGR